MISKFKHPDPLFLGASKGVLLRDDEHYPVYMVNNTKFGIQWGGLFVTRDSLKAIDKFIQKVKTKIDGRKVLKVFIPRSRDEDEEFKVYEAVEWLDNGKLVLLDGKSIDAKYTSLYVYDPEIADELTAIDEKIRKAEEVTKKLRGQRADIRDKLTGVHRYDFEEALKKHGEEVK